MTLNQHNTTSITRIGSRIEEHNTTWSLTYSQIENNYIQIRDPTDNTQTAAHIVQLPYIEFLCCSPIKAHHTLSSTYSLDFTGEQQQKNKMLNYKQTTPVNKCKAPLLNTNSLYTGGCHSHLSLCLTKTSLISEKVELKGRNFPLSAPKSIEFNPP